MQFIGPPSIKDVIVNACVRSASVRWSTNRNEICGLITYNVTLINGGRMSVLVNQSTMNLNNLVPDTNYILAISAMDKAGKGNTLKSTFKTAGIHLYMYI